MSEKEGPKVNSRYCVECLEKHLMLAYEYFGEALSFYNSGETELCREHVWEGVVNVAHAGRHCRDAPDEIKDKLESVGKTLRYIRKTVHNSKLTYINEDIEAEKVQIGEEEYWTPKEVIEEARSGVYNLMLNLYRVISEEKAE